MLLGTKNLFFNKLTPPKNKKGILNLWPVIKKATSRQLIADES